MKSERHAKDNSRTQEILRRYGMTLAFIAPYLLFFAFFVILPIVLGIIFSFMDYNPYFPNEGTFKGFANYIDVFKKGTIMHKLFWPAFKTTILFALFAVPALIIIPLFLATQINKEPPFYKFFRAVLYLPAVTSITIVGLMFGSLFASNESGFFNALFKTNIDFLGNETSRWLIILFVSVWWQTGTNFVILGAALRDVPQSLYEAVEMDGGGKWAKLTKVTLPNIKHQLQLCTFTTIIGYMSLYGQPMVLYGLNNQPTLLDPQTPIILITKLLNETAFANKMGAITAVGILFGLIIMSISLLQTILMKDRKGGKTREKQFKALSTYEK